MSKLVLRCVYSMQMCNLWPIFTVCIAKMQKEFENAKKKKRRQMRSTTITYFDVDMRMDLSIPKLHRSSILTVSVRSTDAICICSDFMFTLAQRT